MQHTTKFDDTITTTYRVGTYYDEPGTMHIVEAQDEDGQQIGELYCDHITGQVMQIDVNKNNRREGVATAMLAHAETVFHVFHSPDEHCTPEGLAFKEAHGGAEIAPELAYQP
ncbi:hypothetical protein [Kocuria sp.]|uniref:hypothetical protein n=1 Tax=Kocuria sp. TaxID=1871328 RepID=UPI0026DEBA27|nr:hypothetical protein [Kocuria sp.]MDO5619313.1 hypothetical protein [Kocuria sp.]